MKAPTPAGVPVMTAVKAGIVVPVRVYRTYVSRFPEGLQNYLALVVACDGEMRGEEGGVIGNNCTK